MTPAFAITANGTDVTARFADRLISITVIDNDGEEADRVEIELDDRAGKIALPEMTAVLEVALGFAGGLEPMGRFAVDGVSGEGPMQTIRITATAADLKGDIRAPRTRAWEGKTLAQIVTTIAGEAGLKPMTGESVAGAAFGYLAQTAESNLHFLTRIARGMDATAKPAGGALIVAKRGEGKAMSGEAIAPPTLNAAGLSSWSWSLKGRAIYKSAQASWADTGGGIVHQIVVGEGTPRQILRHVYGTHAEAARAAQAVLSGAARGAMTLSTSGAFTPDALAGTAANFTGLRPELCGEWHLKTVTHTLSSAGLGTAIEAIKGEPQ